MAELVNKHLQRHLDEIYCLKQNLSYAEEKMAYLSYKKAKEIWVSFSRGSFLRKGQ